MGSLFRLMRAGCSTAAAGMTMIGFRIVGHASSVDGNGMAVTEVENVRWTSSTK